MDKRPARLAGLEACCSHARRDRGPVWAVFWRVLAMGAVAFATGLALCALYLCHLFQNQP